MENRAFVPGISWATQCLGSLPSQTHPELWDTASAGEVERTKICFLQGLSREGPGGMHRCQLRRPTEGMTEPDCGFEPGFTTCQCK